MTQRARVAAVPIGELDSDQVRGECQAITRAFELLGAELSVAEAASDPQSARRAVEGMADKDPDLLLAAPKGCCS